MAKKASSPKTHRILGIDPGLQATGFGVIEKVGQKTAMIESGAVRTPAADALGDRLSLIYRGIRDVIDRCEPEVAAVEEIFVARNVRSTLLLGHARGAAMLAASEAGIGIFEYTALQVKQSVAGYGRAEKGQVQKMITALLSLSEPPSSADAADALAVAWCHSGHSGTVAHRQRALQTVARRGKR